ncbi:K(+)-transporting ATPase subunit F [Sorangium sp. So ce302]|jgi:K+-transporting ATPase KdpF subunit
MTAFTWISGTLALGLLFYLIFALLEPERLS